MVAGDAIPGEGAGASSPQISFIVFDPAPLKKLHILLLKRLLLMVFFLPKDISLHRGEARHAHRERAIPLLPGKLGDPKGFMHPLRRWAFDFPEYIGKAMGGTQANQHMHMIGSPTDGLGHAVKRANGPAKIRMKAAAPRIGDKEPAFFGAEDEMVVKTQIG